MAFSESPDEDRMQPSEAQHPRKAGLSQAGAESSAWTLQAQISCGAAVPDDTGMEAKLPGHQRGAGGQAGGIRGINLLEAQASCGNTVDVGRGRARVPIAAKVIGAKRIKIEVENSHGGFSW